jgi:hypothetical protein
MSLYERHPFRAASIEQFLAVIRQLFGRGLTPIQLSFGYNQLNEPFLDQRLFHDPLLGPIGQGNGRLGRRRADGLDGFLPWSSQGREAVGQANQHPGADV